MISIIASGKGTGKTKKLIDMANADMDTIKGNVVYIDDDNRHMYDLKHAVRFVNLEEFSIESVEAFVGFVYGVVANNYDIEKIYIDGLYNIMGKDTDRLMFFIEKIEWLSKKFSIDFTMTMSSEPDQLPEGIKKYVI